MSDLTGRYEPLTSENAVLVLVDHQVGLMTGVRDISTGELKHNEVALAKAARELISDYASLMVEILKDNARPEAATVYGAMDMPWAKLVGQIAQAYGK